MPRIPDCGLGTTLEEKGGNFDLPLVGCSMERGSGSMTPGRARVNVDTMTDEGADDFDPAAHAGENQALLRRNFTIR
jgi:hypothetical protein